MTRLVSSLFGIGMKVLPLGIALVLAIGCQDSSAPIAKDFSTPQGAVLMLEDAYRAADIEAAVAAKDFATEAKLMLEKTFATLKDNPETIRQTAEVLELAFRQQMKEKGFPDFHGLTSFFDAVEQHSENVVVVTERCRFPDGGYSVQRILVSKTEKGYRVLNPLD